VSKSAGFLPLRRGLWEHIRDGRMSITEALGFIYLCTQADTRNGIWKGSAKSLSGELGIPERTARDVLEKMEHGDYIRRFAVPGRHACYPILIHKFEITQGEHDGEQLDALNSKGPNDLAYFVRQHGVEQKGEHGVEQGAAQRRIDSRQRTTGRKKPLPADPRFGPFLEFAKTSFEAKHAQPPTWDCFGKDGDALASFLRRAPHVTQDIWQSHVLNHFDSTEPFTVKQGGSLAYFVSKFDAFASGPILAASQKGGTNGKPSATDLALRNARALGLDGPTN
jgi:hypothetical protein